MAKYKVALIHNIIAPYRISFFEKLFNHPLIDLSIYFCTATHKMRNWDIPKTKGFNYEILSGVTLEYPGFIYHINPSVINKLINGKYDVVIINGNPDFTSHISFFTCKFLNIPIIWWSAGVEVPRSKLGRVIHPLTKYIAKNVDAIVVPGAMSQDYHVKMGANPNKIFIAPNVLNNDFFINQSLIYKQDKGNLKKDLGFNDKKIILYVGRLVKLKGIEYLINAYSRLKKEYDDICLVIAGSGNLENELKKMCIDQNIDDVHFTGWLSDDKIMYYSIADLFVLPTLKDVWGQVVNEAMCCGLPVITTNVAGCSKDMIIEGENGYVVEPSNADQLYLSIKKIYSDNNFSEMGDKSLMIIKDKFSIDNMVDGFLFAIEHVLKSN